MSRPHANLAHLALIVAACSAPAAPPPLSCPEGQRPTAGGGACEPVPPATDCPAGQMPSLGTDSCHPVGWAACPEGFVPGPEGWGCESVGPAVPCVGATAARLGHADCVPVGDCAAAFPPPDATHFVDARYTAAQLDATHFRSLVDALAAAPAGAVVAVEQGVYPESLRVLRPVRIVGRCAEKVRLTSLSGQYTAIGVEGVGGVEVSGLTIDKHLYAVAAFRGASVTVRDSVLEGNNTLGVYASDPGSLVRLERSVVRATRPTVDGTGWGLLADLGARAELVDSTLEGNSEAGAVVRNAGSTLSLESVLIASTRPNAKGAAGVGILVNRGGHLVAARAALAGNSETGLIVAGPDAAGTPSVADLSEVVVRDTRASALNGAPPDEVPQYLGRGISVQQGGHLTASGCFIAANRELGLAVSGPGSRVQLRDCVVAGTLPNVDGFLGRGIAVFGGATLDLDSSALVGNREAALDVTGDGSRATLESSLVLSTAATALAGNVPACGLLATANGRVDATGTTVMKTAGVGIAVSNAAMTLAGSIVCDNAVGVQAQDGVMLAEVDALPSQVEPLACLVTADTAFLRNDVRVGNGTIPLPRPVTAPNR